MDAAKGFSMSARFAKCPQPQDVRCLWPGCLGVGCPVEEAERVTTSTATKCRTCGRYYDKHECLFCAAQKESWA